MVSLTGKRYFLLPVLFVIYVNGSPVSQWGLYTVSITEFTLRMYIPAYSLGTTIIILGSINISFPGPHIGFGAVQDPCKVTLESPHLRASNHHTCRTLDSLTQKLNNIRQNIVRKLNSTMASIEMIIGATPMNPAVDLQSKKRTRRTTSGVLPFIGEISKVLLGTATDNDVHQQQFGVNQALTLANINAKELNYLGSVLKKAIVIHKENMGINLEAVMANTAAVQNISMAFGRYTVRKHIQEQLISMTKKLKLTLLQLDVQFQTLLSDVIALTTGGPSIKHQRAAIKSHLWSCHIAIQVNICVQKTARGVFRSSDAPLADLFILLAATASASGSSDESHDRSLIWARN